MSTATKQQPQIQKKEKFLFKGTTQYQAIKSVLLAEPIPFDGDLKVVSIGTDRDFVGINTIRGIDHPSRHLPFSRVRNLIPNLPDLVAAARAFAG